MRAVVKLTIPTEVPRIHPSRLGNRAGAGKHLNARPDLARRKQLIHSLSVSQTTAGKKNGPLTEPPYHLCRPRLGRLTTAALVHRSLTAHRRFVNHTPNAARTRPAAWWLRRGDHSGWSSRG